MRSETLLLAAAVALVGATPSLVSAQNAWVTRDQVGTPMARITTPQMTTGATYFVEVRNLSPIPGVTVGSPDSVLAIRDTFDVTGVTYGGADGGCPAPADPLLESCATFTMPLSSRLMSLWVFAWSGASAGTGTVRIRRSAGAYPTDNTVCPFGIDLPTTCWRQYTVTFGGTTRAIGNTATNIQIETSLLPYGSPAYDSPSGHILFFTAGSGASQSWQVAALPGGVYRSGAPCTHISGVACTAEYVGPIPTFNGTPVTRVVAAPYDANQRGGFRLMRNDRIVSGSGLLSGPDNDGDSLGSELETALQTCDSTTSPAANGQTCNIQPQCATPTSTLCRRTLMDSDRDGYRDNVEVYGVEESGPSGYDADYPRGVAWISRFGAEPAHHDVFVELDHAGAVACSGNRGCCNSVSDPSARSGYVSYLSATRMSAVYRNSPSTGIVNRDGTLGIHYHWDIGVGGMSGASVLPDDLTSATSIRTPAGNWGGSSCVANPPTCSTDAQCPLGDGSPGTCTNGVCTNYDPRRRVIAWGRRWLFRDTVTDNAGGGNCNLGGLFCARTTDQPVILVHEFGHSGGVGHGGPDQADMDVYDEQLGNQAYPRLSRMSYLFQNRGGALLTDDAASATVSFASGGVPTLTPSAMPETCPLGTDVARYQLVDWGYRFSGVGVAPLSTPPVQIPQSGCPQIDWNLDGTFEPTGTTVEGRVFGRIRDRHQSLGGSFFRSLTSPELEVIQVQGAPRLAIFDVVGTTPTVSQLRIRSGSTVSCPETPQPTGTRFFDCTMVDSMVGALVREAGVGLRPTSVAAAEITEGSAASAVVVYTDDSPSQAMRSFITSSFTGTTAPVDVTTQPVGGAHASVLTGRGIPSMARVGGTASSVLLTYHVDTGEIVEQLGTVSAGVVTWSGPRTAIPATGFGTFAGSPGIITIDAAVRTLRDANNVPLANGNLLVTYRTGNDATAVELWHRSAATTCTSGTDCTNAWARVGQLAGSSGAVGRFGIAVRPFRVGSTFNDRIVLTSSSGVAAEPRYNLLAPRSVGTSSIGWIPYQTSNIGSNPTEPFVPALVGDQRFWTANSHGAVRGAWALIYSPSSSEPCPAGTTQVNLFGVPSPSAQACQAANGLVWAGTDYLDPAADLFAQTQITDFNEWLTLRYTYCERIRAEMVQFAPFAIYREDAQTCVPEPVYAR